MPNAIEVERLSKRYLLGEDRPGRSLRESIAGRLSSVARERRRVRDEVWSLREVDLTIAEGEAVGVIGRNGAGKSTLLKILSRITEPTSGVARTRGRVTSLLEIGTGFHPELTGRENVFLNGAILGMPHKDVTRRFDEIVSFAGVERFIDTPVKRYSSGMYLRLAFAVAAHLEADIMVVDEVLAVGDAEFQAKCLGRMETAEAEGRTVVFVSHNLDAIVRLCGRGIWLDGGVKMADGPSADVVEAYLSSQAERTSGGAFTADRTGSLVVHSVEVLDESGAPAQVLRRDRPLAIEVRFTVRSPVPGLDLAAYVLTVRGVEVLNEAWSDTARPGIAESGEYVARLDVPPVLNVGEYVVGVWFGSTYETLLQEATAKRFRLEGETKDRGKRAVVLELPWDVRRAKAADAPGATVSDADRA
jgi:ABC-2 type transport system ATP-binding protein/lipopolysaccharide transport system ATP-binding protein